MDAPFNTVTGGEQGSVSRALRRLVWTQRPLPRRADRRELIFAAALLCGPGLSACTSPTPPASAPPAPAASSTLPSAGVAPARAELTVPGPTEVIAREAGAALTVSDLPRVVDASRALQIWRTDARPPESALQSLDVRLQLLETALDARRVEAECARRGLSPTPADLEPLLALARAGLPPDAPTPAVPPVPLYAGDAFTARYLVPEGAFAEVARDVLAASRLRDALLAEASGDTLKQLWLDENTRVQIDVVQVGRVPSTREIDEAVRTRPMEMRAWYDANPQLFVTPTRRAVQRVVVDPAGQDPAARAAARALAEKLRAAAVAGTPFDALPKSPGVRVTAVRQLSRSQYPPAFDLALGQISDVLDFRDGFVFARVDAETPGSVRALEETSVAREVAAAMLREFDELPQARAVAEEAARMLASQPAAAVVEQLSVRYPSVRLRALSPPAFARSAGEVVPVVGLAPALFRAAFELDPARPVTGVVPVRQDYCVGRLVERQTARAEDWPTAEAAFTARWRSRESRNVLREWLIRQRRAPGAERWVDRRRLAMLTPAAWGARAESPEDPEPPPTPSPPAGPGSAASPSAAPSR
jgi:hypothetical protein